MWREAYGALIIRSVIIDSNVEADTVPWQFSEESPLKKNKQKKTPTISEDLFMIIYLQEEFGLLFTLVFFPLSVLHKSCWLLKMWMCSCLKSLV